MAGFARPMPMTPTRPFAARAAVLLATAALALSAAWVPAAAATGTYRNPLEPTIAGDGIVESCADPTVIQGQKGEGRWYMYCTTDPLNDQDKTGSDFNFHLIPMMSSADLVHWRYEGDAFTTRPSYADPTAGLWAPEIIYHPETGTYYLYFTITNTTAPGTDDSAIGVATSPSPLGPWTPAPTLVVEPHAADCCPGSHRWVYDPEVLRTDGADYIYYGSYFGGISARVLSEDGLTSNPATQVLVAIDNKYEGAEVEWHDGYYYLFASATDCCRGPLTGYAVFVGRSTNPLGPFIDAEGVSMLAGRAGGTPVIYQNGNRWVGTGHNVVFQDAGGQWWTIYHAVDVNDPYFAGATGFTKRPALMDAIDWVNGWPVVNGGRGPSDTPQQAPAATSADKSNHRYRPALQDVLRKPIASASDEFNGGSLSSQWTWVRQPAPSGYRNTGTTFQFDTQAADLFEDSNNASVLTEPAPDGNYAVEAKVHVSVPAEGCCFNYVQAGLVVYGNDDNFIKLADVSIWNTRQTEFAKEVGPVPAGYPRYGNTVVGPPGEWTWLRIVKRSNESDTLTGTYGGDELYTAYTSHDGVHWSKGGTWRHHLGDGARIGLVSMGGSGFTADFDYVRVYRVSR